MYYVVIVLIFIVCVLLALIVLIQNSKGGGLASGFSGSNQIMGVRRTADFLEKATWTLALSLLVLSMIASATIQREVADPNKSVVEENLNNFDPGNAPSLEDQAPATETDQPLPGNE